MTRVATIDIGIKDEERNISNKIGRGSFTAVFFVQCLEAIGCKTISLEAVATATEPGRKGPLTLPLYLALDILAE